MTNDSNYRAGMYSDLNSIMVGSGNSTSVRVHIAVVPVSVAVIPIPVAVVPVPAVEVCSASNSNFSVSGRTLRQKVDEDLKQLDVN